MTGSVASTYYGVPRATHDIDFVVQLAPSQIAALAAAFPAPAYHFDVAAAKDWARLAGGSEKQIGDAAGVYEVQAEALDVQYLREWIDRLDLALYWEQLQRKLAP